MEKYTFNLTPEFVKKHKGRKIIEEAIKDLDKIMFQVNNFVDEKKLEISVCRQLLTDIEAFQDMLKFSLERGKFN
ncbi:MAG: hypothetical protein Q8N63_03460 [Nanoarchaeota archaeon]|nr:hypothetical protein [Nanoarchaeota archaeon]